MNERKKIIENIVIEIYNTAMLDNKEDVNYWIKVALDKYLNKNISIEEIGELIKKQVKRKMDISDIKHNYYDKYHLVNSIAESIGNVPEEHIEDILLDNKEKLAHISSEELTQICIYNFKQYRKYDGSLEHKVPKIIEKVLNNDKTKELLSKILLNEETSSTHSLSSVDGTYLMHNISVFLKIIEFLNQYIIIHQEDYKMDDLYQKLMSVNINLMNDQELEKFLSNIILSSIQQKLCLNEVKSIEAREKIAKFVYENYIKNGYCFQGMNGSYKESILANGLSSKFSKKEDDRLMILNNIFEKHGLDKIFFSKLDETSIAPYYYITDNMATAYHYSYHNPEWFSYFCATGNNMPDSKYNRIAYYLRDYDACLNNISKLCEQYKLTLQEKNYVINFFNDYWSQIVKDNKNNIIVFIPRNLINRNKTNFDFSTISDKSASEIIQELISSRYNIDKQFDSIPKEYTNVIDVPQFFEFFSLEKSEKINPKNIIMKNMEMLNYDILIHADNMHIDCVYITDVTKPVIKREQSLYGNNVNIIYCSNKITKDSIISYDQPFQSLEMMIAVNGIANSDKGQEFINKVRNNYSPEYMSNYYYYLANMFCKIALNEKISLLQRASILVSLVKDIYPKAELMRKTNDYPQYIDEYKKVYSYLSYEERLLLDKVKNINNNEIDAKEAIIKLSYLFKRKLENKLNPNFMNEFNSKIHFFLNEYYVFNQNSYNLNNDDMIVSDHFAPKR